MNFESQFIMLACDSAMEVQKKINASNLPLHYFVTHQDEWDYMCRYYKNHDRYPTRRTLTSEFPNIHIDEPDNPHEFYIKKLSDRYNHNVLTEGMNQISKLVTKPGYDQTGRAIEVLLGMRDKIVTRTGNNDLDMSASLRTAHSLYKTDLDESGLIFPVPYQGIIDKKIAPYFMAPDLISIFARMAIGKTWYAIWWALNDWWAGNNVLFFTPEMTSAQLQMRIDAELYGLNYTHMEFRTMSAKEEKEWLDAIKRMEKQDTARFVICGMEDFHSSQMKSWDYLRMKLDEYPDFPCVWVDSAHRLWGLEGLNFVEDAYRVSRNLKQLAKNFDRRMGVTVQAGRESEGKEGGGGLSNIQWGDALGQESDFVAELWGKRNNASMRELNFLKSRRGREGAIQLNYLFEPMDLTEIEGIEGDDEKEFDPEWDGEDDD